MRQEAAPKPQRNVMINGSTNLVELAALTYDEICFLAFIHPAQRPAVWFSHRDPVRFGFREANVVGYRDGELLPGQALYVKDGLELTVDRPSV